MNKTYLELQEIDQTMAQLYAENPRLQQAKIGYAYKRFIKKNFVPLLDELREKIADARVDFALSDPTTKEVITDDKNPRGFKYDKDGLKKVIEAERKISKEYETKEIEIIPYIATEVPELTEEQREILTGCIVDDTSLVSEQKKEEK